jgi:hypothetical protein
MFFVIGQRAIGYNPVASEDHRWEGRIDNAGYPGRVWRDGTIEAVITEMDKALGPVAESAYEIRE